jgi:hypothetical protein
MTRGGSEGRAEPPLTPAAAFELEPSMKGGWDEIQNLPQLFIAV